MTPFLDLAGFRARTVMPPADVDYLESYRAGFISSRLVAWSARMMGRLRKRYPNGFQQPYPEILAVWLVALVTPEAYEARGWNPSDAQSQDIIQASKDAQADLEEAANGVDGLFDLPVSATDDNTAITAPAPRAYTEQDPYTWMDRQVEAYRGR